MSEHARRTQMPSEHASRPADIAETYRDLVQGDGRDPLSAHISLGPWLNSTARPVGYLKERAPSLILL